MKKVIIITSIVLVVLVILAGVAGNVMLNMAIHPDVNEGRDIAATYEDIYREYPPLKQWHDSLVDNGLWRDTVVVAEDGLKRHGLILEHDSLATGATVIVHGYCDNAPFMMLYAYLHYKKLGRNVVIPELFGHGESEGDHVRFGWLDRLDMTHLWLPLTHNLWPDLDIVEHGHSMGGATTMFASGEDIPDSLRVVAFIEDAGYNSTWDMLAKETRVRNLPVFPLLHLADIICQIRYGWSIKESDAAPQLAKCTRPFLFIHGGADDYVPTSMVYVNYDAKVQGYKELMIVEGAAHVKSISVGWDEYVERVKSFLEKIK
ncbi:MAG: alpha/beta hydrolase [Bacteroidales bacterium]|nr:alpha/beta hydrolase [Bacteroidales bacterium]